MNPNFRYCPRCSAPLAEGVKFGRARSFCRYCGFIHFVEPKVAVAGIVSDGTRILLVRRGAQPRVGYWALPAGYMDADETPEGAVVREIEEETGIVARALSLQGIAAMDGWRERRGILLLYRAEAMGGELRAGDDVSDAAWFGPDDVPWDELAFPSTADYTRAWIDSLAR